MVLQAKIQCYIPFCISHYLKRRKMRDIWVEHEVHINNYLFIYFFKKMETQVK